MPVAQLEARILPAAIVKFTGTTLTIDGDTSSNEVVVERIGNQLHVAGQGGTQVTLPGGVLVPELFFTVNGSFNLYATFLGGDDVLRLQNDLQLRSAYISMGDGKNEVDIDTVVFSGKLTIKTGSGCDRVDIFKAAVTSNTLIDTGDARDFVSINESTFVGSTTIKTGLGKDYVRIGNNEAFNRVKCVGKLTIQTGDDCDHISLDFMDTKAFAIDSGNGDDWVRINDVLTYGVMNIKTGEGEDSLCVTSVFQTASGTNIFDLGSETDTMHMRNCSFAAAVTINLGSGVENELTIDDVTFHGAFTLNSQGTDDEIDVERNLGAAGVTTFNRAAKFNLGFSNVVNLGTDDDASKTLFLSSARFTGQIPTSDLTVTVTNNRVSFFSPPVLTNVNLFEV